MRWILVLVLTIVVGGCAPQPHGETILHYERGRAAFLMPAPADGNYILFAKGEEKPRATFKLNKGDRLGFVISEPGRVSAVAGQEHVDSEDQDLSWRRK